MCEEGVDHEHNKVAEAAVVNRYRRPWLCYSTCVVCGRQLCVTQ